jgi:hypothetical protein
MHKGTESWRRNHKDKRGDGKLARGIMENLNISK